jgi:ferredoxin-NADP reductase/MOSC domain-containing protein YiiM
VTQLLSVNVGMPQDIAWQGRTVHTGVWKYPITGKRMLRRFNIDGDGQGDLAGHGGEQRALLAYQIDSYRYWQRQLGRSDFGYGQFGENLTVDGLADDEVCIGDRYRIGGALVEVTQPRVTCYRVGIRMGEPRMAELLVTHHRPGFYLRVLDEGEIEAGDEIVKVAGGPEGLTVAEADALLYLPGHHDEAQLDRALRIPALSPGWQWSFRTMLSQSREGGQAGNAGIAVDTGPAPAWSGFRRLPVAAIRPETRDVFSLELESGDGQPLTPAAPGQFVTLRLPTEAGQAPLLRSYSLSGPPSESRYRISVKQEPGGAAAAYLREQTRPGDTLGVAAPRGAFRLRPGPGPVVLLSAGIGVTPVLAMLHALAEDATTRPVYWIHGAHNSAEHPFAHEAHELLTALPQQRRCIAYSNPLDTDRPGVDFDLQGHLDIDTLRKLDVPREAAFYLCGPEGFLHDLTTGLAAWGVAAEQIRTEVFGPGQSLTPGIVAQTGGRARPPHPPDGPAGAGPQVSFARSGLTVPWSDDYASLLELAEACDVTVRWACRTAICQTCITGLLAGTVRYQPEPVESPGPDNVLICCSQPQQDLTLDL